MLVIDFIKSLFCKHEYEFVRNIHGDEINHMGGKRSIWRCKKCGKFKYKYELELPLYEKLSTNVKQYHKAKYDKWKELRKETLDNMIETMTSYSNNGCSSVEIILFCEEKHNDCNYYIKWLEDNNLKYKYELCNANKEFCTDINKYKFIIEWYK